MSRSKPLPRAAARPSRTRRTPTRLQETNQHTTSQQDDSTKVLDCLQQMQETLLQQQQNMTAKVSCLIATLAQNQTAAHPAATTSSPPQPANTMENQLPSTSHAAASPQVITLPMPDATLPHRPIQSAGLPLGANVKDSLKGKIWENKFIDFHELLNPTAHHANFLSFPSSQQPSPALQLIQNKKQPLTEHQWTSAMDIFIAVNVQKHPSELNSILTYSNYIKGLMRSKANWQWYDTQFRMDREFSNCSWLTVGQDLELQAFCTQISHKLAFLGNTPKQTSKLRVPPGYCFAYH